jgi:hypothetical protein
MATAGSLPLTGHRSLLRSILLGGTLIFIIQFIHQWIVATLLLVRRHARTTTQIAP